MKAYIALLALVAALILPSQGQQNNYKRFCYVESWARHREGGMSFNPSDIGANLCTHLSLAFASLTDDGTQLTDKEDDPNFFRAFNGIKKNHPNIKTLLSVGGWTMGSELFTILVANDSNINIFTNNAVSYLRSRGFDGLDVDWEFPGDRGSPASDKQRFTKLIQSLHSAFQNEGRRTGKTPLLLTAALNPVPSRIALSYEAVKVSKSLDLINLMTYDLHGDWEDPLTTNHHSALYASHSDPHMNIDYLANYWANLGIPKEKILVGLPFYARTYALNDTAVKNVGAKANGPGHGGSLTHEDGTLAFFEVCQLLKKNVEQHQISEQGVPYLVDGKRWVGYDDEKSLEQKVKYVVDHNYGGIMVWTLSLDDFTGACGKKYPLMNAVNNAFTKFIG